MLDAQTISVSVDHPWQDLYDSIWQPTFFPKWASGLSKSSIEESGDVWIADGPEGTARIRFTAYNNYGIMDHRVDVGSGPEIYVPMRVIPNGDGAEVLLTLFRQPQTSDEKLLADADWMKRDLEALKSLFTS